MPAMLLITMRRLLLGTLEMVHTVHPQILGLWLYELNELQTMRRAIAALPAESLPPRAGLNIAAGGLPAFGLVALSFVLSRRSALAAESALRMPLAPGFVARVKARLAGLGVPCCWPSGRSAGVRRLP